MPGKAMLFWLDRVMLLALILVVPLAGCDAPPPIKIGFVGGVSGRVADLGISGRDAVQLSVDEVNEAGGIEGRRVQLIIKDDRQDADTARQAVRELVAEGVDAIIGPMTSDMARAVIPVLNESRLAGVSPTASSEELSGLDDYFFRVVMTTRKNAEQSATYHRANKTFGRVAVAYDLDNRAYSESWLEHFQAAFSVPGNQIVDARGFSAKNATSFSSLAEEVLRHNPDGVLIIANSMDSALLCQQIRKRDARVHITLAEWGATERLLELGGRAVEGVTVIQAFHRANASPAYAGFRKKYMDRHGREPGFAGVYAHDAASVVFESLRRQRHGASLKDTILETRSFQGLQNEIVFDRFGDIERSYASISVVRHGQFVVLE